MVELPVGRLKLVDEDLEEKNFAKLAWPEKYLQAIVSLGGTFAPLVG